MGGGKNTVKSKFQISSLYRMDLKSLADGYMIDCQGHELKFMGLELTAGVGE